MADTVWDLSRAIEAPEQAVLERCDSEPCLGTALEKASDIAHPGGFRRHHVRQTELHVSNKVKKHIERRISSVYIPFINSMLSQDGDEYSDGYALRERIEWLLEDKPPGSFPAEKTEPFTEESHLISPGRTKTTTLAHALLALLKSFIGTGVLFLPNGFKNGGALFSPLLLAFIAYLTIYAMIRLLECQKLVGGTYGYIGAAAYGRWGHRMVQASIVLMQAGFCCTYVIFVATNMSEVLAYFGTQISVSDLILIQTLVYIPLSWIRYISYFAFSNLIADAFILYGLAYIVGNSGVQLVEHGAQPMTLFNSSDYAVYVGTAVFTFEGIGLVIPTQTSLNEERKKKFQPLLVKTIFGLLLFYSGFSMINYAAFGENIAPIVTSSLPVSGWSVSVQFGYSIAQLLSYPLFLFPVVSIVEETLLFPTRVSGKRWEKNTVRSMVVLSTIFIAYYGQKRLDLFVSIVGAFCCVPLSFIYPPLFHLKLNPKASTRDKMMDLCVIAIGIATFLFVTISNLNKWVSETT